MLTSQAITLFRTRNPGVRIRPKVKAATADLVVKIKPSHARSALVDDMCECTGAHALKAKRGVLDAAVGLSATYVLLDIGGGNAEVYKYRTSAGARSVIDANDAGVCVFGMDMTFVPPSPSNRPGVNTAAVKKAQPKLVKHSAEHIAKRVAARQQTVGRRLLSNASR